MKRTYRTFTLAALISVILAGCGLFGIEGRAAPRPNGGEEGLSPATWRELARARMATARYQNISRAIADGYVDIDVVIPNMGFHYLRPAILDETFDVEKPELLVYAFINNDNQPKLVAVEYAVPTSLSETAPEGFTGQGDHWHRQDQFGLWTLHAWLWYPNPDGVFAELNFRVP
jgi:hypothetical protein